MLLLLGGQASAQVCSNPGVDGPATPSGVINSYYPGTGTVSAGSTSITVSIAGKRGAAANIAAGDLIIIMQMQDADIDSSNTTSYGGSSGGSGFTALNNAGIYEYAVVSPSYVTGANPITVTAPLANSYRSATATFSAGQRTFQVIRVPQYASVVMGAGVTASMWSGTGTEYTGGVVAFDVAGQLSWGGQIIDVTGLGFRGAGGINLVGANPSAGLTNTDIRTTAPTGVPPFAGTGLNRLNAGKGEGIAGTPRWINNSNTLLDTGTDGYPNGSFARGAPGNAGGGGTDGSVTSNQNNSGGGGGGAYSTGGMGGYGWTPGTPPMYMTGGYGGESVPMSPARLTMGGGGGAGTTNNATGTPGGGFASSGAAGGGIVIIRTRTTTGTGTINANGAAGNTTVLNDASGGGGGGGAVLMFATNNTLAGVSINANGGNGGSNSPGAGVNPHGPGGGGGGGFVAISSTVPVSVNGGAYGTTNASATTTVDYGSSSSSGGYQLYALLPTDLPGAGSNALCNPLLTVTKSAGTPNAVQGGTATYTLTVTNAAGYGNATGVKLTDVLPGAPSPFTYASTSSITLSGGATQASTANPVVGATSPAWSSFSIPGGGSVSVTFTVNIPVGTTLGTYQNPGAVTYDDPTRTIAGQTVTPGGAYAGGGAVPGSNYNPASSTSEDVTVRTPATFSKSFNPTSISVGGTSVLTVTIGNPAGIPLTGASFSDTYPAGLVNAAVPAASTTCPGGAVTATAGSTSFSLSGATVPIAGCQVQTTVSSPVSGPFINSIPAWALTNMEKISNAAVGSGTLLGRPTITKAFSPIAVATNTNDTLTFTITNPNVAGLTNIVFTDTYPAGLINATPLTTGGSCTGVILSGTTVAGGGIFNVTGGNVPAAGSCTITVQVRSAAAGNYPNTTSGVTSTQTPDAGTPSATTALGVGLVVINKGFAPAQIAPGGTSTVTLTLNNPTGIAQTAGIMTDTLTNMSISANQTAGGTCGAFTGNGLTAGQTALAFSGINIPAAGCTITFIVSSSTTGSNLNTTSGVSTALLPVGPVSNSATLIVAQKPTIAKAFIPASFAPGGTGSIQLTITNPDSIPLNGISFTDNYPANLFNGTPLTVGGSCSGIVTTATAGGSTFNVTAGTVPALSSCTITVPVTSSVAGTYNNATSGVATTETGGAGAASNTATLNVVVAPAVTAKSFSPSLISQGGVSAMTITLQNSNAVPLTNVSFSDALTSMTVANSTIGGSCIGTTSIPALVAGASSLNLTVPTLAAGTSCTVTVQITSNVSGANTNQTSGATSTQTPVAGSPSPVATLNVLRPPQLGKNFLPSQITVGGNTTVTFTVTNPNSSTPLNNVQFSDVLNNMTVASTSFGKTCSGAVSFSPALSVGGTQVNPTLTSLAANESCTISVTITSGTISPAVGHSNTTSGATSTETSVNPGTPASASLDVLGPVTIAKVFSPATIPAGGTSTITLTLTNPNSSIMNGAAFTDVFPAGMTTTNVAQTYTGVGRGTCTGAIPNAKATTALDDSPNSGATPRGIIASINIPASGSCTVMVDVTAAASGSYVNTVSGVTTTQVPTSGPNASATLTVLAPPTIAKVFSPTTIASGANSTLTVNISNPNTAAIFLTALFTDTFPAGMTINTAGNSGSCTAVTATAGAGSFTIANGTSIPAGGCTVIVDVTSSTVGTPTNTIAAGTLQTTAGSNAAASGSLTVVAAGTNRLIYTKSFSQSQVQAGPANANLDMIFTISNLSAGTDATRVRFNTSDVMALAGGSRMLLLSAANSCTITASVPANGCISNGTTGVGATVVNTLNSTAQINFQNANSGLRVNAGAVCTVTCPSTIPSITTGGTYTNTADYLITSAAGFTNTTGSSASVLALKSPTIAKAFAPNVIGAGSSSTLTFTLNNVSNSTALSNATITDTLTNMSISGDQVAGGTCSGAASNSFTDTQTGLITLTGMTLPANGSCTVTLLVTSTNVATNANTVSGVTTQQTPAVGTNASASLTVRGSTLTKAFAPAIVLTGLSSTATFTITNGAGNPVQTGLAFTETLPANVMVASPANASTTCVGGTVTAGSGSNAIVLANGGMALAQATCTVTVDVTSNTAGTYNNVAANVTGTSPGMTNSVNSTLTVNDHPTLTKVFAPATIGFNGTSALTFTIANSTGNPVQSGMAFTDTLPAGVVISAPNGLVGACGGAVTAMAGSSVITLAGGALTAGTANCTIKVDVTSAAAGSYTNTNVGNITGLAGGLTANALSSTLTVVGTTLSKSFTPVTQMLGSNSQLTLTVTNGVGNPAQSGLAFTDTLPAGLLVSTPNGLVNGCGGVVTATAGSNSITLAGGTLAAAAANCTITVNTIAAAAGSYTNNAARISGASSNLDASTVSAAVSYLSQAGIGKAFAPNIISSDAPSTITFALSNANSITLTGATFTDTLTGMAINSNQTAGGTCGGVAGNSFTLGQTGLLTFNALSIPPGGCTVTVVVSSDVPGTYNNTTSGVTTTQTTVGTVSNTAQLTVTAAAPTIAKAFGPATINQGSTSTITFTLNNTNGINLTSSGFSDTMTNMAVSGAQSAGGSCTGAGGNSFANGQTNLTFSGLTIPINGNCTISVVVTSNVIGTQTNQTSGVSSSQASTGPASNSANLIVQALPSLTKAFSTGIIGVGQTATLTFTVTNPAGALVRSGLTFTDTFPANLKIAGTPAVVNGCGGTPTITVTAGAGTFTVAGTGVNAAAGASTCTISVNVTSNVALAGYVNGAAQITAISGMLNGVTNQTLNVYSAPTITKSFASANVAQGSSVNMSFLISNANSNPVSGIAFTDTLPAGLTATNGTTNPCGGSLVITGGNLLTFSAGTVAASPATCTITVPVTGTTTGAKNNTTGVVSSTQSGNGAVSNTATVNIYAPPTVTKTFTPAGISIGGTSSMVITVTNPGGNVGNLTGVSISDTYGGTLKNNAGGGVVCSGAGSATLTGGVNLGTTVGFSAGTIVPGGTCTITQSVTATATVNNSTTAPTSTGPAALTGTLAGPITLTVNVMPTIVKTFTPATVDVYTTSTMTFTLSNSNGNALTSSNFTDTLTGFKVAAPATIGGTCVGVTNSPAIAAGATSLNLTIPSLPSGGCTITIPVSASSAGSYTNTTSGITTADTGATVGSPSNTATLTVTLLALQVTKTPSVFTATPGTIINYIIGYGNPNASTWFQNVVITDPVPVYTSFQSAVCGPFPPGITSCTITAPAVGGTGTVTWTLGGTLDAGSSGTVTLTVKVD